MTTWLGRLTLLQKLAVLLVSFAIGISVVAVESITTLHKVKIGSEMERDIQKDSDLLADVLPPPLYIVEAQGVVMDMENESDPAVIEEQINRLRELRKQFDGRIKHWNEDPHEPEQMAVINGDLSKYANAFFDRAIGSYAAALRQGKRADVEKEQALLKTDYEKQRAVAERLVEDVTKASAGFKVEAARTVAKSLRTVYLVIAVVSALFVAVFVLVLRSIRNQIGGEPAVARDIMDRLAKGETNLSIKVMDGDTTSLFALMSVALDQSVMNSRVRAALDNVTTNVMIADNDRNIIYMNRSVAEMMVAAEADLRKALPNFDSRKLLGGNMDVFHKNPAHQRELLANLRSTYRAQINVGGRTFSLIANPVFGPDGARLGSVVEWKDRTEEVRVEKEVGDIVVGASNGDFSRRIVLEGKEGFFRQLGEGINQLVNTSEQGLKDVAHVLEALSRGDLTRSITADYQGTFGQLKDYSNNTVKSLTQMLLQIREASETINTAANEIASGNADLSSRTEQQASNLEETASSMEELTSTVKQNSDNAKQANQLAVTASNVAQKGGAVVQDVVVTMAAINDSARKIADIISVIDGIAFQTNILALNAAVEAARAGEQGRGFAVVAAEVRNLAQRSASAAKEIKTLITDSVEKVDDGNKLVSEAGTTMQEIVQAIKRVTDLMSEIAAASEEQSSGIEQINGAVTQMDEMTQQNAALVEEASAAAESLREQADTLSQSVGVFVLASDAGAAPSAMLHTLPKQSTKPSAVSKPSAPKAKLTKLKTAKAAKPVDDEWDEF